MIKKLLIFLLTVYSAFAMECEYCPKQEWPLPAFYEAIFDEYYLLKAPYAQKVLAWSQEEKDEELRKHVEESKVKDKHQSVHCAMVIVAKGNPNSPKVSDIILFKSVLENSLEYVEFLLRQGADANTRHAEGITPLFNATTVQMAELLVKYKADLKVVEHDGQSLFSYAVTQHTNSESVELMQYYLKNGADVNVKDKAGNTALHFFANPINWQFKKKDAQDILLKKAALVLSAGIKIVTNKQGKTAQQILENLPESKYKKNYAGKLLTLIQQRASEEQKYKAAT